MVCSPLLARPEVRFQSELLFEFSLTQKPGIRPVHAESILLSTITGYVGQSNYVVKTPKERESTVSDAKDVD
jgi:hypothetical protein